MADAARANPAAFKPTASVYRVGSNGDAGQASYVDAMPTSELGDAHAWLARHAQGGPGVYRVDLRDGNSARPVATVLVRVTSDLRPQRPSVERIPSEQAAPQDIARIVREVLAQELRGMNGAAPGPLSSLVADPFAALEKLTGMARQLHGAASPDATNPATLVRLGLDIAREAAEAAGGKKRGEQAGAWATVVEKHLPDLLEMGKGGLELARDLVKARAKAPAPETTDTEAPAAEEAKEPDAVDAPEAKDGAA